MPLVTIGSLDEKITYRPTDADDPFGGYNYGLMAFTDSDWATSVDTRRSHGCYIVMLAASCIAHRSKAHKSVMLSSAAAEYYEASEGCRELIYIRGILEDFYGVTLPSWAKCLLEISKECRIQCCRVELLFALITQLRTFMYVIELIGY
jgi:hypothetical protein